VRRISKFVYNCAEVTNFIGNIPAANYQNRLISIDKVSENAVFKHNMYLRL